MKIVKRMLLVSGVLCGYLLSAQKSNETIKKEISFASNSTENMLVVQNIHGPISVEGYDGSTIKFEIEKTITMKHNGSLEEGKQEVQVKIKEVGSRIYAYVETPNNHFDTSTGSYANQRNRKWVKPKYSYYVNFKLKVPRNTNVKLAAINDGDIYAKNVQGDVLIVHNINGAITLENVSGKTEVNALNKDINITYYKNPTGDSSYHSLNGDINVTFKENLNAKVSFKSLNGDLYTNYDTTKMNAKVHKKVSKNGKGTKYNVSSTESYQIGEGGIKLDFNLLNGDATLKK